MAEDVQIRRGLPGDWAGVAQVFHAAVREGATRYTPAQREAWSPAPRKPEEMADWFASQAVFVALAGETIVGVMTLDGPGEVDLAYILPAWQGRGLFRALYRRIETQARALHLDRLCVHASLHARGPFEAMGFCVLEEERVERGGQVFTRFAMQKRL